MKSAHRPLVLLCAAAIALSVCSGALAALPRATLMEVKGLVTVRASGGTWRQAALPQNKYLWAKDELQTHQHARARLSLDGATVQVGPLSHIVIPPARAERPSYKSLLQLLKGKLLILLIGARPIEIGTAGATASARGTKFLVDVDDAGLTVLTVVEGAVDFHNDLGSVLVNAGEQSTASPGKAPTRPMRVDPSTFIDWEASPDSLWLGFEHLNRPELTADQRAALLPKAEDSALRNPAARSLLPDYLAWGDLLCDSGRYADAEEAYTKAAGLGTVADLPLRIGYTRLARGLNKEAEASFVQAARTPALAGVATAGQAIAALGVGGNAVALAGQALAAAPQDAAVAAMAGFVYLRSGDLAKATAALDKAAQLDPKEYRAPAYLALAKLAGGDGKAALTLARAAVDMAPGSGLAHQTLGTAAFYAGGLEEAGDEAQLALDLSPDDAAAHLLAAQVAAADGDLPAALQETELAVTLNPNSAPAFQMLGVLSLALNDVARAEKCFRRALELQPKLASAQTGLGQILARQGKFQDALEVQQAAVSLDPGAAGAHNNLGAVYMQTGRFAEAREQFDQALELQPDWAIVHANLALMYLEANEYAEALREGERAVKLGERSARVHTTLARVYLKQDRVNKAWAELRTALDLDPNYALARMHMAEVYIALGLDREANRERLQALSRQPSAMLDSRSYGRSELTIAGGSASASAFVSGRGDHGQNSYFVAGSAATGDWDRERTAFTDRNLVGFFGRQTTPDNTVVIAGTLTEDDRDLPGKVLPGGLGLPTDPDYHSNFKGGDFQVLSRMPLSHSLGLTWRAGYQWNVLEDHNPDSLAPDPNPLRRLQVEARGPMLEARLDQSLGYGEALIAGAAWYSEDRDISGVLTGINPPSDPDPLSYTPFSSGAARRLGTFYADWEKRLNDRTWLLVGGRMAVANDAEGVLRPRALLRYKTSPDSTVALLTRPMLADDVSQLAPVDEWSSRFFLSPLSLARGGFSQSHEAQFELQPRDGSLLRVTLFQRDVRNLLVDFEDPAWSIEAAPAVLGKARLRGVEAEYERWLTDRLSGGVWVRWAASENPGAGDADVPYQPTLLAQARLDYLDDAGWRAALIWQHVGERYADLDNLTKLSAFNTLNLSIARQFDLHTEAFVTVENLLDEEYQFFQGYPGRGRHVSVGLRKRF